MPNKNYVKGRVLEYKLKHNLEIAGYYVTRSSGSHGSFDLIAINADRILCLQLKKNCKISKADLDELYNINIPLIGLKVIVMKSSNGFEVKYVGREPDMGEKQDLFLDITGRKVFD